jgi:cell division protein FtsI/penicillin-binding protein 2
MQKRELWRFWLLVIFLGGLTVAVLVPLVLHQALRLGVVEAAGLPHLGQSPRGTIVDRLGAPLAADRYFYEVSTTPAHFHDHEVRKKLADRLEQLAGIPAPETLRLLEENYDSQYRQYVRLASAISLDAGQKILDEQASLVKADGLSPLLDVQLTPTSQRYYPEGTLAAHVLGLLARPDKSAWLRGYYGVESYYDLFLRKRDGVGLTEKPDATLADLPVHAGDFLPSLAGKDLVLTIDRTVQWIIEEELERGVARYRAEAGTIIVMDPHTGAILGMASLPTFDPNNPGRAAVAAMQNPATSAQYEPGSVFKVFTAAAVLDTGVVTPTQKLTDTGSIAVGERVILNSTRAAWGAVDMTEALARSLNVITAQWALLLGTDRFYDYVGRFGFGRVTEIDLPGEVYGLTKRPSTGDWSLSDLGTNSFGQGLAVTPIQLANAFATVANGGKLVRPYVVSARIQDGQVQYTKPTVLAQAIKPETARTLTKVLVDVVKLGNSAAGVAGYDIAGKSGTAQIPTPQGYTEDETIVTFVGYAPADDPEFVILVKMDRPDPNISPWANYTAAPVFAQVARRLFDYFNIPPDEIRLGRNLKEVATRG